MREAAALAPQAVVVIGLSSIRQENQGQAGQKPGIAALAAMLQQSRRELVRYFVPYNRERSRAVAEEAAVLLLARLLFLRGLEARRIEQPQLLPLLRGWQRIGRRRDLLSLLAGVVRPLQRLYGGPLLEAAPLDSLECEPTPIEPLLEALLDEALEPLLADPLALALAWEQAFAQAPRPWPGQAAARLLDLALPSAGKRAELPATLVMDAGGGAMLALLAQRLPELHSAGRRRKSGAPQARELLAAIHGVEADPALRWGAIAALYLSVAQRRTHLPRSAPLGEAPPGDDYDAILLFPGSAAESSPLLAAALPLLRAEAALGLLLPAEASESPLWEPTRQALFAGWSCAAIVPQEGWLLVAARPEADAGRRAATRIAVTQGRRSHGSAVRQGALAALDGAPLRLELNSAVEDKLAAVAAGRPLSDVALVRRVRPGAQAPERGAPAVRAGLPMLLLRPAAEGIGWNVRLSEGWPSEGGLVVQPLAMLAEHKGSGVRLAQEERAELAPYTLPLLQALLQSRLLALYTRLMLGRSGLPAPGELRRLPVPLLAAQSDTLAEHSAALEAAATQGAGAEHELEALYGIRRSDR